MMAEVIDSAEMKSEGNLSITILLEKSIGTDNGEYYDIVLVFRNPKAEEQDLPILRLVDFSSADYKMAQDRFAEVTKGLQVLDQMEIDIA